MIRFIYIFILLFFLIIENSHILAQEKTEPSKNKEKESTRENESIAKRLARALKEKKEFIQENGDLAIEKVVIRGNKKTKIEVVSQWINSKPGDRLSNFKAKRLIENLMGLFIFSDVNILYKRNENKVQIEISVDENWSIYPVPVFYAVGGTILGGVFITETNLLGYNNGLWGGGIISNRGWQYLVGFVNLNIGYTNFFGKIRSAGGSIYTENENTKGELLQAFQQLRFDVLYIFGYTFLDVFTTALTGGYFYVRIPSKDNIDSPEKRIIDPPIGGDIYVQGIKLIFNNYSNHFYYDKGFRSSLELQRGFALTDRGNSFYNIESQNKYNLETFLDHTLSLGLYWAYSILPAFREHRLGGTEGTTVLPSFLIPADIYLTLTAIYQIPLFAFSWGTFTFVTLFEYGIFKRNDDPLTQFYGPGIGIRFYIRRVTIPAVGADMSYELHEQDIDPVRKIRYSVYVGFRPAR